MEGKNNLPSYELFESIHKAQLLTSDIPKKFWNTLYNKLINTIFDAGNTFSIFQVDYEGKEKNKGDSDWIVLVTKPEGVDCNDSSHIYLIDHAWTYDCNKAKNDLINVKGLLKRMCNLMKVEMKEDFNENVENVCKKMWCFNQTYSPSFGNIENRIPIWYIMDEFGSAIQHSDDPNFRCVPFFYVFEQITYSILFPIKNVGFKEQMFRDFVEGPFAQEKIIRKAMLIPWQPSSFLDVDFHQLEPNESYFGAVDETLGNNSCDMSINKNKIFKVYSEYSAINGILNHPLFELVESANEADILWLSTHFKDFKKFSDEFPNKLINQFPFERVITMKNYLAVTCRRKQVELENSMSDNPPWYPTTYDLSNDLIKFISYYQHREKNGLDNLWICKPWNLARGLDTIITDNLNCIVRLPSTGPKLAQKYLHNPVLFQREGVGWVKFDFRYLVLLKSVKPLIVYVYRNFFLRFANKPFELRDFHDREKHYTVMNYEEGCHLFKMLCDEFVEKFNSQNPGHKWVDVEKSVFRALRLIFEAATLKPPPFGIGENAQSRALYAVDLMLSWENGQMQPKILEVNWAPDCERSCQYYPSFFNDVFLLLFKNECNESVFHLLE